MADERIAEMIAESNGALAATLAGALQGLRAPFPHAKLSRFMGCPKKVGDPTIAEWLEDFEAYARQTGVRNHAATILDHLGGKARDEVLCHPEAVRLDYQLLVDLLTRMFGPPETVPSVNAAFHARFQMDGESLADYSRVIMRLHSRMEKAAVTREEGEALSLLRDNALKEQFVRGVREPFVRQELRRIALNSDRKSFLDMRDEALCLLREHDDGHRPTRVRGAEMSEYPVDQVQVTKPHQSNSVDGVLAQILQSQQQLQAQMLKLISQQGETERRLERVSTSVTNLVSQPRVSAPVRPGRPSPSVRPNSRDGSCFYCKEQGHFIRDCPK